MSCNCISRTTPWVGYFAWEWNSNSQDGQNGEALLADVYAGLKELGTGGVFMEGYGIRVTELDGNFGIEVTGILRTENYVPWSGREHDFGCMRTKYWPR